MFFFVYLNAVFAATIEKFLPSRIFKDLLSIDVGFSIFLRFVIRKTPLEVVRKLAQEEGIESIILCPGFTHKDIAEIVDVVGPNIGVTVARGDGPSSRIAIEAMKRASWF